MPTLVQAGAAPFTRFAEFYMAVELARMAAGPEKFNEPLDKTIVLLAAAMRRAVYWRAMFRISINKGDLKLWITAATSRRRRCLA